MLGWYPAPVVTMYSHPNTFRELSLYYALFVQDDWEPKLFTGAVHVDVRVRRRELRQFNLQRKDFAAGPEGQRR